MGKKLTVLNHKFSNGDKVEYGYAIIRFKGDDMTRKIRFCLDEDFDWQLDKEHEDWDEENFWYGTLEVGSWGDFEVLGLI